MPKLTMTLRGFKNYPSACDLSYIMHVHTLAFFTNVTLILFGIHKNDNMALRNVYLLFANFRPKLIEMFVWNSKTDLPTYSLFGSLPKAVLAQFSVCPFPGLRHCHCGGDSCKLRPKFKKSLCGTQWAIHQNILDLMAGL